VLAAIITAKIALMVEKANTSEQPDSVPRFETGTF
jgi:hypothetical protein